MRNLYRVSHLKNQLEEDTMSLECTEILCVALDQDTQNQLYFATREGLYRVHNLRGEQWDDPDPSANRADDVLLAEEMLPNDDEIDAKMSTWHRSISEFKDDDECGGDVELLLGNPDSFSKAIIAIEYLVLELCCAWSDGKVCCYALDTGTVKTVAYFQHGIEAMQWQWDQQAVVFVDKKLNMVTMTGCEYRKISEVQLMDGTDSKGSPTKGTESENERFEEYVEQDSRALISWREDGKFFAVSFKILNEPRAFKVFNEMGTLQYSSEKCYGLDSALAWQPSGRWIAMPQVYSGGKIVIALFEKNGLRTQEIPTSLNQKKEKVVSLHWSPMSEVLAVYCYSFEGKNDGYDQIFLYGMDTDNWILKQCLIWPGKIYGVQWEQLPLVSNTLHLITLCGEALCYERIRFAFRVDRSVGHGEGDEGIVAVIDSNQLRLSSFSRSIIPAAMCSYTLTLPEGEYINAVGFIRYPGRWASMGVDLNPNAFFVVDSANKISFYDVTFTVQETDDAQMRSDRMGTKHLLSLHAKVELNERGEDSLDSLIHWLWLNPDHVVLCCNNTFVVLDFKHHKTSKKQYYDSIKDEGRVPLTENEIIACVEAMGADSVLIELSSGRLMRVKGFPMGQPGVDSFSVEHHNTLPEFCEQLFIDQQHSPAGVYAFSQTRRNLYRNELFLMSEVTSVFLSEEYLLFTTFDELKFVILGDNIDTTIFSERRLKRGEELVTVVPNTFRTIFQLPRGNLEAISARVLPLCLITKHLEALEYRDAFDIMRKERINLNLLVDHDAERFLAHLDTHFLAQITNVSWLNLFITDLTNQDVCRTMYESNYPGRQQLAESLPSSSGYTVEGKVQFICGRLLGAMDSDPSVLTLPKITCHVKQGQLEKALSLIWMLERDNPKSKPAEEALRYLESLVEVNVLYDTALGMYDLDLAQYVDTKLKKDTKKCSPFLNKLKRLDEHERKHRIDCHLERYDRVLVNISRREPDEGRLQEVLELIDTHALYTIGIECYRTGSNKAFLRKIYERYADHLCKGGKHVEASLMYERMDDIRQAINSARHALDWRRVLRLSARSKDPEAVRPVLCSLVPALVEAGEHDAAATIAHEQLKDVRLAVDCLLKGARYERALLMVVAGGTEFAELYETIREHLRQYLSSFIIMLAADREQLLHQKGRLQAARANPERQTLPAVAAGEKKQASLGNGRSGKLTRSTKSRCKRPRLNPKEDNPTDAIAPIDALHALVLRVCSVDKQRNVRSICQVALELRFEAEAQAIQRDYGALFELISCSLDSIWTPLHGQHQDLIEPNHRCKPVIQPIDWKFDILK